MKKRTRESAEFSKKIQNALRTVFPPVVVRENIRMPNDGDDPVYDVFFVPDDRRGEFVDFMIKGFSEFAKTHDLPEDLDLISHGNADTQKFFPEIKQERAIATSANQRKARKIEKSKPAHATKR